MASPVAPFVPGFAIALKYETVSDTVDYSPNQPDGGFARAVQKPRFQSDGFALSYNASYRTQYHFGVAQRQLNSLRDAFTINEFRAGIKRRIQSPARARYSLDVGASAHLNQAAEIYKNSYTAYSDKLITEVRLVEPRDARFSMYADLAIAVSDHVHVQIAVSGGLSQTSQQEVVGVTQLDNNCRYAFSASEQGGSLSQLERCGNLVSYKQQYPDNQTLSERLGFSVADDVTYRDYFVGPRTSLHWHRGLWSFATGYEFRQYWRPTIDHRIRQAGDTPVTQSHTAFANANVLLFRDWQVDLLVRYQRAAFLDDIPFLYSALTYERYSGKSAIRYGLSISRFFN